MSTILSVTYESGIAVTNSDSAPISGTAAAPKIYAGFYTGAGGDITVTTALGDKVKFAGTAAGIIIPVAITQVWSTGTTPTNVVALVAAPYSGNRKLG
jgi:hypothetical protein